MTIYIFGRNNTFEYNPTSDQYTSITNMPTPRNDVGITICDDKIYVIGGESGNNNISNKIEIYDPLTNSWAAKSNLPISLTGCNAATLNNKIYILGYQTNNYFDPLFYEYNPNSDTFIQKKMFNIPFYLKSNLILLDTSIYILSGFDLAQYNITENNWVKKKSKGSYTFNSANCVVNKTIHVIGGQRNDITTLKCHQVYNSNNDTWSYELDYPYGFMNASAAVVNGKIYVCDGYNVYEYPYGK